jgi:hypothetical protein
MAWPLATRTVNDACVSRFWYVTGKRQWEHRSLLPHFSEVIREFGHSGPDLFGTNCQLKRIEVGKSDFTKLAGPLVVPG